MEAEAYREMYYLEEQHWWYRGMRDITENLLTHIFDGRRDLTILDAGCGTGMNLTALKKFGQVTGFDFSALALAYAQQRPVGRLAQASIEQLPYAANRFDLVTSFDVIYNSGVRDDVAAIREMGRVVRPQGYVVMRVPALPSLKGAHDAFVHGVRRYTARELEYKFREADLTPIKITYANSLLLPLIFAARRWQRLTQADPKHSDVQYNPSAAGEVLYRLLKTEGWWIKKGGRFGAGVSLFGVAQKQPASTTAG